MPTMLEAVPAMLDAGDVRVADIGSPLPICPLATSHARVGSERRLIRAEMASIMRETAAAAATRVDTYTTARVTSSRRVAKYLMFCTLRAIETDDESVRGAKTKYRDSGRRCDREPGKR